MRNPWLCITIVCSLAGAALLGILGAVLIALEGRDGPALMPALVGVLSITTTSIGSLGSFLVQPPRGSFGAADGSKPE